MTAVFGRTIPLESTSKFRRLAIVHATMIGGDAAMVVALANSLFFSIDPSAARERILLFLTISFAPFLLIAPLIGPMLDRIAGGRRAVIQFVAVARIVLSIMMAFSVDRLVLFPMVFAALVLQKTYTISKSALVPSVVRTERDLVEANSKLGLIAGLIGAIVVMPAALIQITPLGGSGTLIYSALIFGVALVATTWLSADVVAGEAPGITERLQLSSNAVRLGALVQATLRASVGFTLFMIAMVLKADGAAAVVYGAAVASGSVGAFTGNFLAPRLRARVSEQLMLLGALSMVGVVGLVTALLGSTFMLVVLAYATNVAAAIGRSGFEAILQRDAPAANRGRAFALFETRFQFSWALGGVIPVVVTMSGRLGSLIVGLVAAGVFAYFVLLPRVMPGVTVGTLSERAVTKFRDARSSDRKQRRHRRIRIPRRRKTS